MPANLRPPDPVPVLHLFAEERAALLNLLGGLTSDEWDKPTVCAGWSVREVALHILGGDLGNIARRRDGFQAPTPSALHDETLVQLVNRNNDEWVYGARRLSPRLIIDLLRFSGPEIFSYFASLDLSALGGKVSWAGNDPAPVWLDVAREYTERWHHQQHIRDAVGKPGLTDGHFMGPVLATFVFALPMAFQNAEAPEGTIVHLHIEGEAGGDWALVSAGSRWTLYSGVPYNPEAMVTVGQDTAWRLFTKGIAPLEAEKVMSFEGDQALGRHVLRAISIIA